MALIQARLSLPQVSLGPDVPAGLTPSISPRIARMGALASQYRSLHYFTSRRNLRANQMQLSDRQNHLQSDPVYSTVTDLAKFLG